MQVAGVPAVGAGNLRRLRNHSRSTKWSSALPTPEPEDQEFGSFTNSDDVTIISPLASQVRRRRVLKLGLGGGAFVVGNLNTTQMPGANCVRSPIQFEVVAGLLQEQICEQCYGYANDAVYQGQVIASQPKKTFRPCTFPQSAFPIPIIVVESSLSPPLPKPAL